MRIKWENIAGLIIAIIVLINIKTISNLLRSIFRWFASSINGLNHFPQGAQTAIAFALIAFVLVFIDKTINK